MSTEIEITHPIVRIEFKDANQMFDYAQMDREWDKVRGDFGDLEELLMGCDSPQCKFVSLFDEFVSDNGYSYCDQNDWDGDGSFLLEWSDVPEVTLVELAKKFQAQTMSQALGLGKVQIDIDGDGQYSITIIDTEGDEWGSVYGHFKDVDEDEDEDEEDEDEDEAPVAVAPVQASENDFAIDLSLNRPVLQMQAQAVVTQYDEQDAEAIQIAQVLANLLNLPLEVLI